MMGLSELLTSVKMKLGIYGISIPVENLDQLMHDVIKLESIKTYSQFFPQTFTMEFKMEELDVIQNNYAKTTFVLPDLFAGRRIIYVRDVFPGRLNQQSNYMYAEMATGEDFYQTMMLGHAQAHLASAVTPPFTFEFEHPNIVHMYNYSSYSRDVTVKIDVEHFENLSSIPPAQFESFRQLVILDMKIFLYGMLKHYTDLSTPLGNISLKIDDWANAEATRDELINEWTASHHLEHQSIYFI